METAKSIGRVAVLTGDLIQSSRLKAAELNQARETLLAAVSELKAWKKGFVLGKSEFFRGDSWQVCLANPEWSLRAALFLRARLREKRRFDTRVAIGIGEVERLVTRRISLSSGEAFSISGMALDRLPVQSSLGIVLGSNVGGESAAHWLPAIAALCAALVSQAKPRQSAVLALALLPVGLVQQQIAARIDPPVSQQAVHKALGGLHWQALQRALEAFETASPAFR